MHDSSEQSTIARPLVEARAVSKRFVVRTRITRRKKHVLALDHVDFAVPCGATVGLVGESGSGKSTLAACLSGLESPSEGEVLFEGEPIAHFDRERRFAFRKRVQLIFQDSAAALNPRFSAEEIITEPLLIQRIGTPTERRKQAAELMEQVGLSTDMLSRRPAQFSGGQRQRLAIARALALRPSLLILDEALSGLDLPVQAQILKLLASLKRELGLAYLFISHDLGLVSAIAESIAVMFEGRIVEAGATREIIAHPQHVHTQALIAATPRLHNAVPRLSTEKR